MSDIGSIPNLQHIFNNRMKTQRRICLAETQPEDNERIIFSLKCLDKSSKSKLNVRLDFTGLKQEENKDSNEIEEWIKKQDPSQLLPQFSYSDELQMRAFFSSGEKATFKTENKVLFQRLLKKTSLDQNNYDHIMTPKPTSYFCQVCRQTFQDYLQHIQHPNHKKKLFQSTKSTKMIQDLMQNFEYQSKRARSQKIIHISDFQQQQFELPSIKVRVIQNQSTLTPIRLTSSVKLSNNTKISTSLSSKIENQQYFSNNLSLIQK